MDASSAPGSAAEQAGPFRVAYVRGVTPAKWARIWEQRRRDRALELVRTDEDQVDVVRDGRAHMAFVRLPIDQAGLNVIPLYHEIAVVVVPTDHVIAAVDEIAVADLHGEDIHDAAGDIDKTFALVAAGVGVAVVPQSIARLHARRDLTARPVTDAPSTRIALAWLADAGKQTDTQTDADVEADAADIEDFIGIVRGRTVRSSRGMGTESSSTEQVDVSPGAQASRRASRDAGKRRPQRGANRSRPGRPRRRS